MSHFQEYQTKRRATKTQTTDPELHMNFVKALAAVVTVVVAVVGAATARPTATGGGSVSWLVGISLCPNSASGTARSTGNGNYLSSLPFFISDIT